MKLNFQIMLFTLKIMKFNFQIMLFTLKIIKLIFQTMLFKDNDKIKFRGYYCNNANFSIYISVFTLLLPVERTNSGNILTT